MIAGLVVSSTEMRIFTLFSSYSFESILRSSLSEKSDTFDLASNILRAYSEIFISNSLDNFFANSISVLVVVGLLNSSVSERIQERIKPFISFGACIKSSPIISAIIDAVDANGLIVIDIGLFVFKPPIKR